jgi:hypothetical protein
LQVVLLVSVPSILVTIETKGDLLERGEGISVRLLISRDGGIDII